jgi:hypothetical protein
MAHTLITGMFVITNYPPLSGERMKIFILLSKTIPPRKQLLS